jgi:hypothetical protein
LRQKDVLVHPLGVHVNEKPFLGSTFLGAPKGGIQVFLSAVVTQRQLDLREDGLVIPDWTIIVPEQAGIRSDPKPTFTQHGEIAERSDGIWVLLD